MNSNFSDEWDDTPPDTNRRHCAASFALDAIRGPLLALWYDRLATSAGILAGLAVVLPVRYTVGWPSMTVMLVVAGAVYFVAYGVVSVIEGRRSE